jgi:hypothetical protein
LFYDGAESGAGSLNQQGKKLVITDEYFQRVTQALVIRIRQHEESVMVEGKPHAPFAIHCFNRALNIS